MREHDPRRLLPVRGLPMNQRPEGALRAGGLAKPIAAGVWPCRALCRRKQNPRASPRFAVSRWNLRGPARRMPRPHCSLGQERSTGRRLRPLDRCLRQLKGEGRRAAEPTERRSWWIGSGPGGRCGPVSTWLLIHGRGTRSRQSGTPTKCSAIKARPADACWEGILRPSQRQMSEITGTALLDCSDSAQE